MRQDKILSVTACALVLVALVANNAIGRMPFARPHILPLGTFPRQIGGWRAGPDVPITPDVQRIIPTAHVLQRVYTNGSGKSVSLVLITATDYHDFHDPTVCFPGHGWVLTHPKDIRVGNQEAHEMSASLDGETLSVIYWLPGEFISGVDMGDPMKKLLSLRKLVTGDQGASMVVRVSVDQANGGAATALKFAAQILGAVNQLAKEKPRA